MDRKKLREIVLVSACVIAVYFLFERAGTVLNALKYLLAILAPFLTGACLAFILNVPMRFFENRAFVVLDRRPFFKRLKRPLALLVVFVLVAAVLALLLSLVIPQLKATLVSVVNAVPGFVQRADAFLAQYDISLSQYLGNTFKLPTNDEMNMELSNMLDLVLKGVAFSGSVIGTVYDNVLSVFFTLMFTLYFLFAKERLRRQLDRLMRAYLKPRVAEGIVRVSRLTQRTFASFLTGQCLEALILGALFFLFMSVFRMPYALLISLFIAVMALIPVIGAWIGCITGALLILLVDPMTALGFVILFIVLQQLEGNLIYPHVMGNAIGLPSLWVLFAVVVGEGLMGVAGMLLFIPLTSVGYTLLREDVDRRVRARETPAKP